MKFNFRKSKLVPPAKPAAAEDVAIIGLSLRLPQANTLDQFWSNLIGELSSISEVPEQRWSKAEYYGDPRKQPNKTNSIWGGFIEQADCFDAEFFNISPREAQSMDPQQRFALELSWQAIEDAGYRPSHFAGSNTGVYMGVCHWDYAELFEKSGLSVDAYFPTGSAYSIIANRVSHYFDLAGPSIINDTACASSLVSVYQAVRAIQNGEIDTALAGGVNLCWSVNHFIAFSKNGMLSREGLCKAFDSSADGYVRGEGGAVLLLKSLRQAQLDGDTIHAVIKGIGTNHGGRTNSLTVTNPKAQAKLITQVYSKAGIAPASVSYIEAHGPGTPLGDPFEVMGLKQAFAALHQEFASTMSPDSCGIGSVKTNIGHLEGAAGVAGMLKVVAAMQHKMLPANVNFKKLNPMIKLADSPFYIVAESKPWQSAGPRRAGVSSFGFGGNNAHVVLEEFIDVVPALRAQGAQLIPLSARNTERLETLALSLLTELPQRPDTDLTALAYTLQCGREAMAERVVFAASDVSELITKLELWLGRKTVASCWRGNQSQSESLMAILGSDQGFHELAAQWIAARQLEKIGAFWVGGAVIAWELFYPHGKPQRLRLPTYPFAKVRHWFATAEVKETAARVERLHPLLHKNVSTLKEQAYSTQFDGSEFFLADHLVAGRKVLPGVAHLEMVRAALALALDQNTPLTLKNMVWMRPIDEPQAVLRVSLIPQADGEIAFAIASGTGDKALVHSQGQACHGGAVPAARDIAALKAQCTQSFSPADCYKLLGAAGMVHGPSLQGLKSLLVGPRQVLAELVLPASLTESAADLFLHPTLLDSAIQATVALLRGTKPALPFAIAELHIDAPCTSHMWAWVRHNETSVMPTFDIELCDQSGQVCVRMLGLALRSLGADVSIEAPVPVMEYSCSEWRDQASVVSVAEANETASSLHIFVAHPGQQHIEVLKTKLGAEVDTLPVGVDSLQLATTAVLARLQSLLSARSKARVFIIVDDDEEGALFAPLAALLKTVKLESSRVDGKLISVAGLSTMNAAQVASLIEAERHDAEPQLRIDSQGRRQVRDQSALSIELPSAPVFKQGGVYWITGGLGGLGKIVTGHLLQIPGIKLVLSGRAGASAHGMNADYIQADVGVAVDVERVVSSIVNKYGALNGIIHCAGVLEDAFITNKTAQQVASVFAPKVTGTRNIDQATRNLKLDFMLLFSSVVANHGGAGQADYSVANAFLDAFAEQRQALVRAGQRSGNTVAVNWPLWETGGMQMDAANVEAMRRRSGMLPLPSANGLQALETILASGRSGSVAVVYREAVAAPQVEPIAVAVAMPDATADVTDVEAQTIALLKTIIGKVLKLDPDNIRAKQKFEHYGFDSIMAVEMTLQLEGLLGSLPKTLFFEYVDLHGVAGYLIAQHKQALVKSLNPQRAEPAVLVANPPQKQAVPLAASMPLVPKQSTQLPSSLAFTPKQSAPRASLAVDNTNDLHDVAVIGLAGRYPHADTMEQFWEVLSTGQHCFEKIPSERWRHAGIYHNERDVLGKSTIQNGSFLADIDKFDPRYFNISQRDAELMSPEVRLFLQVGVEAFEDAGYSREQMHKRFDGEVGVLVGTMSNHYNLLGFQNMLTRGARASGSYTGTLPNMLSYFYGFSGPSIFLDTMCSAAATCIDQGVHMLRSQQCKMVLAGGANLLLHPYNLISSSQEHFTTKSSELIRSYGQGADGTILGEGIGAVLLKPLRDAIRDKDHIYGVIKGTAINNAGVRNGFTVPSPTMQAKVVQKALLDAAIDPRTISYVEGHGSGTKLGDPIEIKALTQAWRSHTQERQFCPIGSVKSNIAHLLAAAGVAGFTKVLLQLKHSQLVPSLHSQELNPDIPFADSPFFVQRELAQWLRPTVDGEVHPRRAGITSIGAGGMNSHIIVEEYSAPVESLPAQPRLVVLSAMSKTVLLNYLERLNDHLTRYPDTDLAALSYTLQVGRNALPCRFAVVVPDIAALSRAIAAFNVNGTTNYGDPANSQDSDDAEVARALAVADLHQIGAYWLQGAAIDWDGLWLTQQPQRISLPTYPFEKVSCWYEVYADAPTVENPLSSRNKLHPFIGRNISDVDTVRFETDCSMGELLDYAFHRGEQQCVLSGFVLDAALALPAIAGVKGAVSIHSLKWQGTGDWATTKKLITAIGAQGDGSFDAQVTGQSADGAQQLLAAWRINQVASLPVPERAQLTPVLQTMNGTAFYRELKEGGLDYSPYLEGVSKLSSLEDGSWLVSLHAPELRQHHYSANVRLEPYVLGALVQVAQYLAKREGHADWFNYALLQLEQLTLLPGDIVSVLMKGLSGTVQLLDGDSAVLGNVSGVRFGSAETLSVPQTQSTVLTAPADDSAAITAELVEKIRIRMSAILKFAPADIDLKTPFYSFGFDSISMTELSAKISVDFGLTLTPALFFEVDNVQQLVTYLLKVHGLKLQDRWRVKHRSSNAAMAPAITSAPNVLKRPLTRVATTPDQRVAIIGAAGKFPGAENLDAFWDNLVKGHDAIGPVPMSRYGKDYRETVRNADFLKRAGILDGIDHFDAGFFNISRTEAELMDPQHRLFLETTWVALESSGYCPSALPSKTGVYVGVSANDYATLLTAHGVPTDAYTATGTSHSMLANRVSFFLDVHGPSEAIDTACSSSLVALHRAIESIRSGHCDMAIAGGVNVALAVDTFVGAHQAGMLSPDGKCQTFSAHANGYVRGEGVAALVLKPLAQAERDGDVILGVLLGSAENHGGRANSLTSPNPRAQSELIMQAMRGIDAGSITYLETHGTGTSLGDPVEINGLKRAFAELGREPAEDGLRCGLGSVKSNIGHLEAAAGIAGVVKVLLALKHRQLPASLHCDPLNPFIELAGSPFYVVRETSEWTAPTPRRAGVSSFGFGGANAHVVIEEYSEAADTTTNSGPQLIVLSARNSERLRETAKNLSVYLEQPAEQGDLLARIAWTLQVGREAMQERLAFAASSLDELKALLRSFLDGVADARLLHGSVKSGTSDKRLPPHADATALLRHWIDGGSIAWEGLYTHKPRRIALPTYPFARDSHWIPSVATGEEVERLLDNILNNAVSVDDAAKLLRQLGFGEPA